MRQPIIPDFVRTRKSSVWLVSIILIIFITLIITNVNLYRIKGNSMSGTINEGEIVLIWKPFKFQSQYQKNQVVLFQKEENEVMTSFVKRIVSVPGDTIFVHTQKLLIGKDSYPHDEIFYLMSDKTEDNQEEYFKYLLERSGTCGKERSPGAQTYSDSTKLMVPPLCYFMIGDNPYESMDSRFWGFIHENQIVGKMIAIF